MGRNDNDNRIDSRDAITAALCRVATERQGRLSVHVQPTATRWTLRLERETVSGGTNNVLKWLEKEQEANPAWPEIGWVHVTMSLARGRSVGGAELRRNGQVRVRVLQTPSPVEAGIGTGGYLIERVGDNWGRDNHVDERAQHPMFKRRQDAMEYARQIESGQPPKWSQPEMTEETIEITYRTPDA